MQSRKQKLDVGRLLTGLNALGSNTLDQDGTRSALATSCSAPGGVESPRAYPSARSHHGAAVRVGGLVVGHVTAGEYRSIQNHLAAGGQLDITLIFS